MTLWEAVRWKSRLINENIWRGIVGCAIIVISVFRRFNGTTMFVIFDVIERDLCELIPLATIVGVVRSNLHGNVNVSNVIPAFDFRFLHVAVNEWTVVYENDNRNIVKARAGCAITESNYKTFLNREEVIRRIACGKLNLS